MKGKVIAEVVELQNSQVLKFTDNTFAVVSVLSDVINPEDLGFISQEESFDNNNYASNFIQARHISPGTLHDKYNK